MNDIAFSGHLTAGDARILSRLMSKRQPGVRLSSLMMGAGLLCFLLAAIQGFSDNDDGALSWSAYGFAIGAVGVGLRWSEGRASRKSLRQHEHNGRVLEDGVQLLAADSETLLRWSAFTAVDMAGDLLVLWLADRSCVPLAPALFPDETAFRRARAVVLSGVPAAAQTGRPREAV